MAYVRHNWDCGDTITAEKLNDIERGLGDMDDRNSLLFVLMHKYRQAVTRHTTTS